MDNGAFRAALLKRLSLVDGDGASLGSAPPGSAAQSGVPSMGGAPPGSSFLEPVKDPAATRRGSSARGSGVAKLNMGSPVGRNVVKRPPPGGALPPLTAAQQRHLAKIRAGIDRFGRAQRGKRAVRPPADGRMY